jgi:hypothetical protein
MSGFEEDKGEERSNLILLGRDVGTFTGWDQGDTTSFVFYGFKPKFEGWLEGDLSVDYENGNLLFYDDEGNIVWEQDIVNTLKEIAREPS